MPINYEVDESRNVILASAHGTLGDAEFLDYARRLMADSRIQSGYRELVDLTAAVKGDISQELFDLIAAIDRQSPDRHTGSRTAIVVPDPEGFQLASTYALKAQAPVIVFSNIGVARTWLGI